MSYFKIIKRARWVRAWNAGTYYTLSVSSGPWSNGVEVPDLTKLDEAAIRDFFLEHDVEQNGTHELWWKYDKFVKYNQMPSGNTTVQGGIKFDMSKEAYERVFKVGSDLDEYDDMSEMCDNAFN